MQVTHILAAADAARSWILINVRRAPVSVVLLVVFRENTFHLSFSRRGTLSSLTPLPRVCPYRSPSVYLQTLYRHLSVFNNDLWSKIWHPMWLLIFVDFEPNSRFIICGFFSPSIVWCSSSLHIIYICIYIIFVAYELFDFCNSSGKELNRTENVNAKVCPPPHLPRVNMEFTDILYFFRITYLTSFEENVRHI